MQQQTMLKSAQIIANIVTMQYIKHAQNEEG